MRIFRLSKSNLLSRFADDFVRCRQGYRTSIAPARCPVCRWPFGPGPGSRHPSLRRICCSGDAKSSSRKSTANRALSNGPETSTLPLTPCTRRSRHGESGCWNRPRKDRVGGGDDDRTPRPLWTRFFLRQSGDVRRVVARARALRRAPLAPRRRPPRSPFFFRARARSSGPVGWPGAEDTRAGGELQSTEGGGGGGGGGGFFFFFFFFFVRSL